MKVNLQNLRQYGRIKINDEKLTLLFKNLRFSSTMASNIDINSFKSTWVTSEHLVSHSGFSSEIFKSLMIGNVFTKLKLSLVSLTSLVPIKVVGGGGKLGLLQGAAVGSVNDEVDVFDESEFNGKATLLFKMFLLGDLVCSILSLYENFGGSFHPASVWAEKQLLMIYRKFGRLQNW